MNVCINELRVHNSATTHNLLHLSHSHPKKQNQGNPLLASAQMKLLIEQRYLLIGMAQWFAEY